MPSPTHRSFAHRAAALAAVGLSGCGLSPDGARGPATGPVTVRLDPIRGTTAAAEVRLASDGAQRVRVAVRASGLRPRWSYTFFVAERADCGGSEAGGARTIPLAGALRAIGELPPLVSDAGGNAEVTLVVRGDLRGPLGDFAGRALVLQPDGYGRAACGGVPPG